MLEVVEFDKLSYFLLKEGKTGEFIIIAKSEGNKKQSLFDLRAFKQAYNLKLSQNFLSKNHLNLELEEKVKEFIKRSNSDFLDYRNSQVNAKANGSHG